MDRRKFFISTAIAGGSIAAFPACKAESKDMKKNPQEEAIEKVSRAMCLHATCFMGAWRRSTGNA